MYLCTRKSWLNFGSHSPPDPASGSRNFLKDSSTLWDRAFFDNLAYISGDSDQIFMKILPQKYHWTRKLPLDFGSNQDPQSVSGYRLWIQTIFSLADCMRSLTAFVLIVKSAQQLYCINISIMYNRLISSSTSQPTDPRILPTMCSLL